MAKKNYRKSPLEKQQHEKAVKIRKMTDEQLCDFIDEIAEGNTNQVKDFLNRLEELKGTGNGINTNIIKKLCKIAESEGFMKEN